MADEVRKRGLAFCTKAVNRLNRRTQAQNRHIRVCNPDNYEHLKAVT